MTFLLAVIVAFATRVQSDLVRLLAVDAITLILVAVLVLYSSSVQQPYYLDAAIALALMSFIGTVAAARRLASDRVL
jgi:multicomponent Na+:H+ antiporter subunit F